MSSNLKSEAASGVRWTTLNTISSTSLQFAQLAILGRVLGPEAFGLMAMVLVVTELGRVFQDFGLSSAIVQRKDVSKEELSSLYWVNILFGSVVCGVVYFATPAVARVFRTEEINGLLRVTSLSFVITPFGVQFQALLRKTMRFDILTKFNIASVFLSSVVAVIFALKGYGAWSLVWGALSRGLFQTIFLVFWGWKSEWWPSLHFRWSDTRGYLSFGMYRLGAMAANQFNSRVDQLVVGAVMGPGVLGYYNMAFRLVMQPIQRLNPILTTVAFPVFSIVQDDPPRLKRGFMKMVSFIMAVNTPALVGLAVVAPVAVPFLVGAKWSPCVPVMQILAFYALARSLFNVSGTIILAKGKANWAFYWNSALLLLVPPILYLASMGKEVTNIALALVGLQTLSVLCLYRFFIPRLIGPCFYECLQALGRPTLLATAMAAVVMGTSLFVAHMPMAINLLILITTGALVYVIFSWFFQRELLVELTKMLPRHAPSSVSVDESG